MINKFLNFLLLVAMLVVTSAGVSAQLNHPTGRTGIIMVDKIGSKIRFFAPSSLKEIAQISTPQRPHDFALTADHKTAYVTVYGDGIYGENPNPGHEILVVDTTTHKMLDTIDISPFRAPHGIQIDSQGLLYVACDLDRKVLVVDPKSRKVVEAMDAEGASHWVALLADDSKVYASNKNDQNFVSVMDTKTRKLVAKVPAAGGTEGITSSPDGKQIAVLSFDKPVILLIDPKTDRLLSSITLAKQTAAAFKPYFSPNGRWLIVLSEASGSINIINRRKLKAPQKVLNTGKGPMGAAFSPDGSTALIANHGEGTISVIDLKKQVVTRTFRVGEGVETLGYY